MNMPGIDFAQMFAPQPHSAGQGAVVGDGSGAEGFLAALQQTGGKEPPSGEAAENLLASIFEELGLERPQKQQQFLQWLQGEEGAAQLESAWSDRNFDTDELIALLENFAVAADVKGENAAILQKADEFSAGKRKAGLGMAHSQAQQAQTQQVQVQQVQAQQVQAQQAQAQQAQVQQAQAQQVQAQQVQAQQARPQQAKAQQEQPQQVAPQQGQSQLLEMEVQKRIAATEPVVARREMPARTELVALLTQALRPERGQAEESASASVRTTQQVLDDSQAASLRTANTGRSSANLESRFSELFGFQPRPEGQNQGDQPRVQMVVSQPSAMPAAALSGGSMGDAGQRDFEGFFPREAALPSATSSGHESSVQFTLDSARATTMSSATPAAPGMFQTPSGQPMPENQLLDQVARSINLQASGDRSQMTLRLHPEELGELRLELVMEKGGIKAHIQAQTAQVQEVLERHMPRLREAFAQQGLQLDDVEVSLD
ncbi:MAG: flagellar hook-length control protein FliK, partial [Thermodesulfobacteriota bacterium]|nr:flagellar hook-length control protein FliK [Thermodesulfobacteriota bacterium]